MLLSKLHTIHGRLVDIQLSGSTITSVSNFSAGIRQAGGITIEFENALVFPGLINSHDHLDFDLFPKLGNRIYRNYVEWGNDIHLHNKDTINSVLKVPQQLRVQWGIYKNLLAGVTTVVNHGPRLEIDSDLNSIFQDTHVLHSVQLEKRWRLRLNKPFRKAYPFSIHIGEGTDDGAREEIKRLVKANLLKRILIGIHAVAMEPEDAHAFKAIVWCPDSNYFLLGQTAAIDKLKSETRILFGTDSTVSAGWDIWEQLRLARQQNLLTDQELYDALTTTPAEVWPVKNRGTLEAGCCADLVIAKLKRDTNGMDAFYAIGPEDILIVMHQGTIRLFDASLEGQLKAAGTDMSLFSRVEIGKTVKYIQGNVPGLLQEIKQYYPEAEFPVRCL